MTHTHTHTHIYVYIYIYIYMYYICWLLSPGEIEWEYFSTLFFCASVINCKSFSIYFFYILSIRYWIIFNLINGSFPVIFYCNGNCDVGSHKNTKKYQMLACHYGGITICLVQVPDDGLIESETCSQRLWKRICFVFRLIIYSFFLY